MIEMHIEGYSAYSWLMAIQFTIFLLLKGARLQKWTRQLNNYGNIMHHISPITLEKVLQFKPKS